jgi:hypothetical protein
MDINLQWSEDELELRNLVLVALLWCATVDRVCHLL